MVMLLLLILLFKGLVTFWNVYWVFYLLILFFSAIMDESSKIRINNDLY